MTYMCEEAKWMAGARGTEISPERFTLDSYHSFPTLFVFCAEIVISSDLFLLHFLRSLARDGKVIFKAPFTAKRFSFSIKLLLPSQRTFLIVRVGDFYSIGMRH